MIKIIRNVCHQSVLDFIFETAAKREAWHWKFPMGAAFDKKHAKLDIVEDGKIKDDFLAGLASSVLLQVWEANNRELFIPEIFYAGVAIKDRHRKDNVHVDDASRNDTIKVMGILNNDWDPETMGGGFMHGGSFINYDLRIFAYLIQGFLMQQMISSVITKGLHWIFPCVKPNYIVY